MRSLYALLLLLFLGFLLFLLFYLRVQVSDPLHLTINFSDFSAINVGFFFKVLLPNVACGCGDARLALVLHDLA